MVWFAVRSWRTLSYTFPYSRADAFHEKSLFIPLRIRTCQEV